MHFVAGTAGQVALPVQWIDSRDRLTAGRRSKTTGMAHGQRIGMTMPTQLFLACYEFGGIGYRCIVSIKMTTDTCLVHGMLRTGHTDGI